MVGRKTAALFRACAEVGAIAGGGDPEEVDRLGGFAWNAGVAFQLVDDYLGAVSDERTLGKPVGSDLREGKKTLIIIHALSHASPGERGVIEKVLGAEDASPDDLEAAIEILRRIGSLDHAVERAREYADRAKALLDAFPDSESKRGLMELVDYFMDRAY